MNKDEVYEYIDSNGLNVATASELRADFVSGKLEYSEVIEGVDKYCDANCVSDYDKNEFLSTIVSVDAT